MSYRIRVLRVEVAEFTIVVGEPMKLGTRPAIPVHAAVQTSGLAALVRQVKADFTSWIHMSTGDALAFRVEETAGKDDATIEKMDVRFLDFAGGKFPVTVTRPDDSGAPKTIVEHQVAATPPIDLLTLLMQLRSWEKPGRRTVDAVRSRYIWRTDIRLVKRENVRTELGVLPALRFEADSRRINRDGSYDKETESRHITIWISDDADRVPIKLIAPTDYGVIEMAIADYAPGPMPNLASVARTQ